MKKHSFAFPFAERSQNGFTHFTPCPAEPYSELFIYFNKSLLSLKTLITEERSITKDLPFLYSIAVRGFFSLKKTSCQNITG